MMRVSFSILSFAVAFFLGSVARADPPPTPAPTSAATSAPTSEVETESHWYGWQNLVSDGVSLTAFFGGIAADSNGLAVVGTVGWGVGSPIIHLAHRRPGIALASLGLRTLPVVGAYVGAAGQSCGKYDDVCGLEGAAIGLLVGIVVAVVVDDVALAREDLPKSELASRSSPITPEITVFPTIARSFDGRSSTPTFGIGGSF